MTIQNLNNFPPEKIHVVLTQIAREELARIFREQNAASDFDDDEIDQRIARLDETRQTLKQRARRKDYTAVTPRISEVADSMGMTLPASLPNDLGRRAVDLIRDLLDIEGQALDGEDARREATPLVARYSDASVDTFVSSKPILLSETWSQALVRHPSKDMRGNINAIAKLAIGYFSDIPVDSITQDDQKAFFVWMARLPKNHGKAHGKNRFCRDTPKQPEKYNRSKDEEIAQADAEDARIIDEIRSLNHLSTVEKRALLADRMVPRLTLTTVRRNRDGLNRLFKAAKDLGCKTPLTALSYKAVEEAIRAAAPDDPLYVRVTQPKLRMPWTEERLAALLTSPLYAGCFSQHRRWRPGNVIIRDALYWVPLIVLTVGSRIGEILILKRKNFVIRNGVACLQLNLDSDQSGKTEDAQRVVPIPQLLLDLGFADWIRNLDDDHGPLLFPDAAQRASGDDITGPFSKALNRILDRLGVGDFDEDFYAMRKTLSSMLAAADVKDGQRQAIAGHKNGSILNRYYTAHHTRDLKAAVDSADFNLAIAHSAHHGFPVIASCGLARSQEFSVEVSLDDAGEAETIYVSAAGSSTHLFSFNRIDPLSGESCGPKVVRDAAQKFRQLIGENSMVLPRNALKRAAIEHFHALG